MEGRGAGAGPPSRLDVSIRQLPAGPSEVASTTRSAGTGSPSATRTTSPTRTCQDGTCEGGGAGAGRGDRSMGAGGARGRRDASALGGGPGGLPA